MKNQFVSYEIAIKLKGLGFNEPCLAHFISSEGWKYDLTEGALYFNRSSTQDDLSLLAPLWQQVFDWFREKYLIDILILPQDQSSCSPTPLYFIALVSYQNEICEELFNSTNDSSLLHYSDFESAREAAILKVIELCQK